MGNVRNPKTGNLMKLSKDYRGYYRVGLASAPGGFPRDVHRLVALAFLGEPPKDKWGITFFVNHKNGVKADNTISNLEYVTTGENTAHYHSVLRPASLDKVAKLLGLKCWREAETAIIRGQIKLSWIIEE